MFGKKKKTGENKNPCGKKNPPPPPPPPHANASTINPTNIGLGSNLGLCSDRPLPA